jgi:hypothetical protein
VACCGGAGDSFAQPTTATAAAATDAFLRKALLFVVFVLIVGEVVADGRNLRAPLFPSCRAMAVCIAAGSYSHVG